MSPFQYKDNISMYVVPITKIKTVMIAANIIMGIHTLVWHIYIQLASVLLLQVSVDLYYDCKVRAFQYQHTRGMQSSLYHYTHIA